MTTSPPAVLPADATCFFCSMEGIGGQEAVGVVLDHHNEPTWQLACQDCFESARESGWETIQLPRLKPSPPTNTMPADALADMESQLQDIIYNLQDAQQVITSKIAVAEQFQAWDNVAALNRLLESLDAAEQRAHRFMAGELTEPQETSS